MNLGFGGLARVSARVVTTLAALLDVRVSGPADRDVLTWVAADGKWENAAAAVGGAASGDLSGTYPAPEVVALQTYPLPAFSVGDGFLKLDAAHGALQLAAYGTASNSVCQGNDTRLSNARTPTAHASTHAANGTDHLDWDGTIHASDSHANRPSAAATNKGYFYYETDTLTLFRSDGATWTAITSPTGGSAPPSGSAGGDLGLTYPTPDVLGLQQDALPTKVADGFLKRNAGNSAWEEAAYGIVSNTVCQGNDSRLSNARTPTGHHLTHEPTGSDMLQIETFIVEGTHASRPAASNSGSSDNEGWLYFETDTQILFRSNGTTWEQIAIGVGGTAPPSGAASGDLSGNYPDPEVVNILGDAVPSPGSANGFLKRNSGNTAWEEVAYGSAANTVTQGNDSRLSNSRTPTAHASTHLPAASDPIDWTGRVHQADVAANRPAASSGNAGCLFFATDTTILYRSDGSAWTAIASVSGSGGTVTSVGLTMPSDFAVGGSPVTGSGTLAVTANNQSANIVKAGPSSGAAAAPTYRALVAADLPVFVASGGSHAAGAVPDPGSSAGTTKFLREDASFAVPAGTITQAYQTVQDEGTALTQRSTLNVVGRGLIADDSGGVTRLRALDPATMSYEWEEFYFYGGTANQFKLGWQISGGSNCVAIAAEAGRPGLAQRVSGAAANTVYPLWMANSGGSIGLVLPADSFDTTWIFRPVDMDANTTIRVGLMDGPISNPPTNGCYIEGLATDYSAGMEWFGVTRATTQTRVDTTVKTAANAWVKFRIWRVDGTHIGFSVNDSATVQNTATIPTVALQFVWQIVPTSAATRKIDLDYFDILVTGLSR